MTNTAIALFIFKRPDTTLRVFKQISKQKPRRLYVIADGPRNLEEQDACEKTRSIIERVDWNCDIQKNYANENMGLRKRIISGLNWVFSNEEQAIILEDVCLLDFSFFRYCEELLDYYRDDEKVMHISGDNCLDESYKIGESYYFSKYAHVWGWATWRRAWQLFDQWDHSHPKLDTRIFTNKPEARFWMRIHEEVMSGRMDYTWDYQWSLTCLAHKAYCINPASNLISNIGFGENATHTKSSHSKLANISLEPMVFPLHHPTEMGWNNFADDYVSKIFFQYQNPKKLTGKKIKKYIISIIKRIVLGRN